MEQFILWFNIAAFTLMFGSFGATYMVYGRYKVPWLRQYILYLASYALFLLIITYRYFNLVYLPHPNSVLDSIVVYLRLIIDLILLYIVPRFIFNIIPQKVTNKQVKISMIVSAVIFFITLAALIWDSLFVAWISKFLFNIYLGLFTVYGLMRIRSSKTKNSLGVVLVFLYLSSAFYVILVVLTLTLLFFPPSILVIRSNIIIGGIFCFLWGGVTIVYLIHKILKQDSHGEEAITDQFMDHFNITTREREVISLLLQGKSNREIGDKLFVSSRTVEVHIYNIYRKCSVKNRLELANLVLNTGYKT